MAFPDLANLYGQGTSTIASPLTTANALQGSTLSLPVNPAIFASIQATNDMSNLGGINGTSYMFFKDPAVNMATFETPSTLMVLNNSSSKLLFQTNKFLLQNITKPQQEKFQIIETFGDPHVFFYGTRAKVYTFQGVLLDGFYKTTPDSYSSDVANRNSNRNMWATAFQNFYETQLRGTKLKDNGNIAAFYVNGWLIKGYPINLTIMKEANQLPDAVNFQMTMVIDQEILLHAKDTQQLWQPVSNNDLITKLNTLVQAQSNYGNLQDTLSKINQNQDPTNYQTTSNQLTAQGKIVMDAQQDLNIKIATLGSAKARAMLNMN